MWIFNKETSWMFYISPVKTVSIMHCTTNDITTILYWWHPLLRDVPQRRKCKFKVRTTTTKITSLRNIQWEANNGRNLLLLYCYYSPMGLEGTARQIFLLNLKSNKWTISLSNMKLCQHLQTKRISEKSTGLCMFNKNLHKVLP